MLILNVFGEMVRFDLHIFLFKWVAISHQLNYHVVVALVVRTVKLKPETLGKVDSC